MIKSELVQIIAGRNPHLYVKDVEKVVDAILDEITGALSNGDGSNCAVSERSRSSTARRMSHETRRWAMRSRSSRSGCRRSSPGRGSGAGLTAALDTR